MDQGLFFLQNIANLANDTRGKFSITLKNNYYLIAVGDHKYMSNDLSISSVMDANVYILASIKTKEGW